LPLSQAGVIELADCRKQPGSVPLHSSVSSRGLASVGGVVVTLILTVWASTLPRADLTSSVPVHFGLAR
jgi:hypothetical protein